MLRKGSLTGLLLFGIFFGAGNTSFCSSATMSTSVYFFMRLLSHNSMSCVLDLTGDFFSDCCFAAALS